MFDLKKCALAACCMVFAGCHSSKNSPSESASWGSDHVGQPAVAFTSGDECLFCHRMDVGPTWSTNRHGQNIREIQRPNHAIAELEKSPPLAAFAQSTELMMGDKRSQRFLKRSAEHGRLDLLSVGLMPSNPPNSRFTAAENPHWDAKTFGANCAGCHATGVDSAKQTFSAISLDCFVCHGEPAKEHTKEGRLALLSKKRDDPPAVVTSICAQCHLRTGISKSSGRPYPNNFVAGDNLFRDFHVDFSDAALQKLNPVDRHVHENVRDVALLGLEGVTCLSCHDVHTQSVRKHHNVTAGAICLNCHSEKGPKRIRKPFQVHSETCGY